MQKIIQFVSYAVVMVFKFTILLFVLVVAVMRTITLFLYAMIVTIKRHTEQSQENTEKHFLKSRGIMQYEVDFSGDDGKERVTGTSICHTTCEIYARMEVIEMFGFLENFKIDEVRIESNQD